MEICVDFDGTCTTHMFPEVGEEIGAVPVLKKLVAAGHRLILFTMRSEMDGISPVTNDMQDGGLNAAVNWFKKHDIPLYGIQTNPTQKQWTSSPKAYGQLFIDDAALGCPLIYPENGDRPYVDWKTVEDMLQGQGILPYESPILIGDFQEIFNDVTEEVMNGERVINITEEVKGDGIYILKFNVDAKDYGYHHEGDFKINTETKSVRCLLPEVIEGCGIEEGVERRVKELLGY